MKITELEKLLRKIPNFASLDKPEQVDYLAYFLTIEDRESSVTSNDIEQIMDMLNLRKYERLSAYLSENTTKKTGKYVKKSKGYRLEKITFDEIDNRIKNTPEQVVVDKKLQELTESITDPIEKDFIEEVLNCYRMQANRSAVVMCWNLTIWHLKKHIFEGNTRLDDFNEALKKAPVRNISEISKMDDFDELKEGKFIELAESANIISKDVKKILLNKLDTRNTYAHPTSVRLSGHKTTEFIQDLMTNLLLKY